MDGQSMRTKREVAILVHTHFSVFYNDAVEFLPQIRLKIPLLMHPTSVNCIKLSLAPLTVHELQTVNPSSLVFN